MLNIQEIFNERSCHKFSNETVAPELLQNIYNLMKLGPTSYNSCPLRIIFIQSPGEKEKLYKCLLPANVNPSKTAPVNILFAYDIKFYEKFPVLFPAKPDLNEFFSSKPELTAENAFRNSSLQAAYFIIIARSMGLACGPMSGFDTEEVNKSFFSNSSLRINFICNLGFADGDTQYARLPRLNFEECCKVI